MQALGEVVSHSKHATVTDVRSKKKHATVTEIYLSDASKVVDPSLLVGSIQCGVVLDLQEEEVSDGVHSRKLAMVKAIVSLYLSYGSLQVVLVATTCYIPRGSELECTQYVPGSA